MKDILGRELKDGDLCIGMAIGRNSSGMHIGVFQGSSVVKLSNNEKYLHKSCTSNTYLIENPSEEELVIKNKILVLMEEEAKERERKSKIKTIPLSKLEVGGIYKTVNGCHYLYLGKHKVTFKVNRNVEKEEEGNCFVGFYYDSKGNISDEEIVKNALRIHTFNWEHNVDVLKGNKKLVEMVRKVNLEFPMKTRVETIGGRRTFELIVE